MKIEDLSPEQIAFLDEVERFNVESQTPKRWTPAQRVLRKSRAKQLAVRAKALFPLMKVELS